MYLNYGIFVNNGSVALGLTLTLDVFKYKVI